MCWQASPAAERQGRHVKEKEKAVFEFSVLSNVSVCGGCAGVAGKGALRRVWPRSRQGARKSRLANGLAPPQGHLQIHSTPPSPPPSHHKLKDKIKQWFNVLPFMFIAVTTRTPRCCQELRRRVHRAAHKPAWKTPGRQIKRSFCFFFPLFCFLMDATHPEYNGVEEEDEFEEHIGESVAVADLVVAGHGAARVCWQLAGSPRLASALAVVGITTSALTAFTAPASARTPDGCTAVLFKDNHKFQSLSFFASSRKIVWLTNRNK